MKGGIKWTLLALALLAAVAAGVAWQCRRVRAREAARAEAAEARRARMADFGIVSDGTEDFLPLPSSAPHNAAAARVGAMLFHDRSLIRAARSCGTCHRLNHGGVDDHVHAGALTRPAKNAVFASRFLHDGSVTNLAQLVETMLRSRTFAAAPDLADLARSLADNVRVNRAFELAYGGEPTPATILDGICQYERTLFTHDAAFDRHLRGVAGALTPEQVQGFAVFRRRKCIDCHEGPALGTTRMKGELKVPALRGISHRRAYLHDGSVNDLAAAVARMPGGESEDAVERALLLAFLRCL